MYPDMINGEAVLTGVTADIPIDLIDSDDGSTGVFKTVGNLARVKIPKKRVRLQTPKFSNKHDTSISQISDSKSSTSDGVGKKRKCTILSQNEKDELLAKLRKERDKLKIITQKKYQGNYLVNCPNLQTREPLTIDLLESEDEEKDYFEHLYRPPCEDDISSLSDCSYQDNTKVHRFAPKNSSYELQAISYNAPKFRNRKPFLSVTKNSKPRWTPRTELQSNKQQGVVSYPCSPNKPLEQLPQKEGSKLLSPTSYSTKSKTSLPRARWKPRTELQSKNHPESDTLIHTPNVNVEQASQKEDSKLKESSTKSKASSVKARSSLLPNKKLARESKDYLNSKKIQNVEASKKKDDKDNSCNIDENVRKIYKTTSQRNACLESDSRIRSPNAQAEQVALKQDSKLHECSAKSKSSSVNELLMSSRHNNKVEGESKGHLNSKSIVNADASKKNDNTENSYTVDKNILKLNKNRHPDKNSRIRGPPNEDLNLNESSTKSKAPSAKSLSSPSHKKRAKQPLTKAPKHHLNSKNIRNEDSSKKTDDKDDSCNIHRDDDSHICSPSEHTGQVTQKGDLKPNESSTKSKPSSPKSRVIAPQKKRKQPSAEKLNEYLELKNVEDENSLKKKEVKDDVGNIYRDDIRSPDKHIGKGSAKKVSSAKSKTSLPDTHLSRVRGKGGEATIEESIEDLTPVIVENDDSSREKEKENSCSVAENNCKLDKKNVHDSQVQENDWFDFVEEHGLVMVSGHDNESRRFIFPWPARIVSAEECDDWRLKCSKNNIDVPETKICVIIFFPCWKKVLSVQPDAPDHWWHVEFVDESSIFPFEEIEIESERLSPEIVLRYKKGLTVAKGLRDWSIGAGLKRRKALYKCKTAGISTIHHNVVEYGAILKIRDIEWLETSKHSDPSKIVDMINFQLPGYYSQYLKNSKKRRRSNDTIQLKNDNTASNPQETGIDECQQQRMSPTREVTAKSCCIHDLFSAINVTAKSGSKLDTYIQDDKVKEEESQDNPMPIDLSLHRILGKQNRMLSKSEENKEIFAELENIPLKPGSSDVDSSAILNIISRLCTRIITLETENERLVQEVDKLRNA